MAKAFCGILCAALMAIALPGCGGVESEPIGEPVIDDGMEGVDPALER